MECEVLLTWDGEAGVWVAESGDLPGLIMESPSLETLEDKVRAAAPELAELSGARGDVRLRFTRERQAVVA